LIPKSAIVGDPNDDTESDEGNQVVRKIRGRGRGRGAARVTAIENGINPGGE
jgi:hypothetical protein